MTRRSRAREVALQLLVWRDMNPTAPAESVDRFVHVRLRDPIHEPFARRIYDGVIAGQSDIDAAIVAAAENWRLPRMPAVDRNVLRIGVFEMRDTTDPSPPAVVINEAIELARRYGSADSPAFVNGVLDQIKNQESEVRSQESEVGDQESAASGQSTGHDDSKTDDSGAKDSTINDATLVPDP
jgi:N utilization substance protein B